MGIRRIKGSTARCWYCALGLVIALFTMVAMFWIAWCYFGLTVVQVSESQRRAIVDYSYITSKPSNISKGTSETTVPSEVRNSTSIESSLNTISRTVTASTHRGGSNREDATINLKKQKKNEEAILPDDSLAKGDFASRDRTISNNTAIVKSIDISLVDKGSTLLPKTEEGVTAISNRDGLRVRNPPTAGNRPPTPEEDISPNSRSTLSTSTQLYPRDDGSNKNYEESTSKDILDSRQTSLRREQIQSSRRSYADSTERTLHTEDFPSDTRRTRYGDEGNSQNRHDDRVGNPSRSYDDDKNSPRQYDADSRDSPRRNHDDRSIQMYDNRDRGSSRQYEDDKDPRRRYKDDDSDSSRRYEDGGGGQRVRYEADDRDSMRRYKDDDSGPSRRYEKENRGQRVRYKEDDRDSRRRYKDDDRGSRRRYEDDDRGSSRRYEDDDRDSRRRHEDADRGLSRRYEEDDRGFSRRYEDDDIGLSRRYEVVDGGLPRRYEDDDKDLPRRYDEDDKGLRRRYEDEERRPVRRYENDDKDSRRRYDDRDIDDRYSKGDFKPKPPSTEEKIESDDERYRGRDKTYRDDVRDRLAKDDQRYKSIAEEDRYRKDISERPRDEVHTLDDQSKSREESYRPRDREDRDPLTKRTGVLDSRSERNPYSIPADGRTVKSDSSIRDDRFDSSIRDDRVVKEYSYPREDRNTRSGPSIIDDRDTRRDSFISDRRDIRPSSAITDDRDKRVPDFGIRDDINSKTPYSSKRDSYDIAERGSTLKDDRRASEVTDEERYRYRPLIREDDSRFEKRFSDTSSDDKYRRTSRYDNKDRIIPTRVRDSSDSSTKYRYNGRDDGYMSSRLDENDRIVPTKVRDDMYTPRSTVSNSRMLSNNERRKDERFIGSRYDDDERRTGNTRGIPTIVESSRTRDDSYKTSLSGDKRIDSGYVDRDKVILDRRSYASEDNDEYRRNNSRTRTSYDDDYDKEEYRRPSRVNDDEYRRRDDYEEERYYSKEYRRDDRVDDRYDRSDERTIRKTDDTPIMRVKEDAGLLDFVEKERRGQIPSTYLDDEASPHTRKMDRRYTDDVPSHISRTSTKNEDFDRSTIYPERHSEEVLRHKRFQQPQSDKRQTTEIEEISVLRSETLESTNKRPVNAKDVIEAALRESDRSNENSKNIFYPVFDPRTSNLTSPDIIRPSERRGTTILSRKKRYLL